MAQRESKERVYTIRESELHELLAEAFRAGSADAKEKLVCYIQQGFIDDALGSSEKIAIAEAFDTLRERGE